MSAPETFIATITNEERNFYEDMELPSGMQVSELCRQILMILKDIHEELFSSWTSCRIESNNRLLNNDETLAKAGVFDGSIIVVKEVLLKNLRNNSDALICNFIAKINVPKCLRCI